MTVNYSFDLEDDDFLDDTFRSIPENDLLSYSISSPASESPLKNKELKNFQTLGTPNVLEHSNTNTGNVDCKRKNNLSILFKGRESVPTKQKEVEISENHRPNKSVNTDESTKIDSRFMPGFTPAKKRKLPGLANFFSENPVYSEHLTSDGTTASIEIQNITNSQFSSEDLLLLSWQNLQAEVSSCQNLLSTAKYYSIRRVLHETSKKKLPKHLVVPVLCVLIKKFNAEESSLVFIDDTGEMSGKIDKEVLDEFKDAIRERTAIILKKVTCICNILFLKKQNLVSIYLDDGSVKHVQDLNSILDKEEPLKPMNCQCPGTPNEKTITNPPFSKLSNFPSTSSKKVLGASHKMTKKIVESSSSNTKENSCNIKNMNPPSYPQIPIGKDKVLNILEAVLDVSKSECSTGNSLLLNSSNQINAETSKSAPKEAFNSLASSFTPTTEVLKQNLTSKALNKEKKISYLSNVKQMVDTVKSPLISESSLEELFCEDTDDFDEILCSLDEKSFLEEM